VEEFDPLPLGRKNRLKITPSLAFTQSEYSCELWCELLHLEGAQPVAFFMEDYYKGAPAVTVNSFGKGRAFYIATQPELSMIKELFDSLKPTASLESPLPVSPNIEVVNRTRGDKTYLFILNHGDEAASINLDQKTYRDLLTGRDYRDAVSLAGYGVAVLVEI
jgi:beta-galactosidase